MHSAEDLQKKIERLTELSKKKSEDHTFVNNTLRATDLGQDRYRFVNHKILECFLLHLKLSTPSRCSHFQKK
jgi:hypothetical protein